MGNHKSALVYLCILVTFQLWTKLSILLNCASYIFTKGISCRKARKFLVDVVC